MLMVCIERLVLHRLWARRRILRCTIGGDGLEVLQTFASVVTQAQVGEIALRSGSFRADLRTETLFEGRVMDPEDGYATIRTALFEVSSHGHRCSRQSSDHHSGDGLCLHHAAGCQHSSDERVKS